jgi:WhiB family redox-sensing transcriptional regulator
MDLRGTLVSSTRPAARRTSTTSPPHSLVHGAEAEARIAWVSQARCRQADPDELFVRGGMTERQRRALLKQHPEVVSWADFFAAQRKHRSAV